MNLDLVKQNLKTNNFKHSIIYYEKIDSTNTYCKNNYKILNEKTIVIAQTQEHGRGKNERKWISPIGGLYFSILLKEKVASPQLLPIISALAIYHALKKLNINIKLKWPNDIILNNKKLGGILVESKISNKQQVYIIGIGLNIKSENSSLDLKNKFISLKQQLQYVPDNELILSNIINEFETLLKDLNSNHISKLINDYKQINILLNQKVILHSTSKDLKNVLVLDVNDDGSLKVQNLSNNCTLNIYSGEFSITGFDGYI